MSFFTKLRERLSRSSSKIGEGLDDIVAEGAADAEAERAPPETPIAPRPASPAPVPQPTSGMVGRLFARAPAQPAEPRRALDDEMLEDLEDMLVQADLGVETALRVTANIAEGRMGRPVSATELKELLAAELARIMEPVARPLPLYPKKPQVVLVVGVNGSGKTTTIAKLAHLFQEQDYAVMLAAGDTFRAAAIGQLGVWAERLGIPIVKGPEGGDPASVVFDAVKSATDQGIDALIVDTAGRLQNKRELMDELAKIRRVLGRLNPEAPHDVVLVLDATNGQNALSQIEIFKEVAGVSGLIMTKLDGTARGGVLVQAAEQYGLPIHAIGVGEKIDDLRPFDPDLVARVIAGVA